MNAVCKAHVNSNNLKVGAPTKTGGGNRGKSKYGAFFVGLAMSLMLGACVNGESDSMSTQPSAQSLNVLAGQVGIAAARLSAPFGVCTDGNGDVYVADTNNTIRKITPAGDVSTLAGLFGVQGSGDGVGTAARFSQPRGVACDASGNLYVADTENSTIRKVSPSGVVTTLAGTAGAIGHSDGVWTSARFRYPSALAIDGTGNVYVADTGNATIRKITPAGVVTTLAGTAGTTGSYDGMGTLASFDSPQGIDVDALGNVYVTEFNRHTVRKVTPNGMVTTIAGMSGISGDIDGAGFNARFSSPLGIAVDAAGNIYVADTGNYVIRKISSTGAVSTFAGSVLTGVSADGVAAWSVVLNPRGVATDGAGNVYVSDVGVIRKITPMGEVVTLAGSNIEQGGADGSGRGIGYADGTGAVARFYLPSSLTFDSMGNAYVADYGNNIVRKISQDGVVTTLAGMAGTRGSSDGVGVAARFDHPWGVAADVAGNVYVADTYNSTIRKISPLGNVTTLAGSAGVVGNADGTGAAARFDHPHGIVVDAVGNVYVADTNNSTIRKITPAGEVTTLAGIAGALGSIDGLGSAARFYQPYGLAMDGSGNLYVSDDNSTIRKITPTGEVTTLAGLAGSLGQIDGTGGGANFRSPRGITTDSAGNLYVADYGNNTIRKITSAGVVTTVAGTAGTSSNVLGSLPGALASPTGVALYSDTLYILVHSAVLSAKMVP